jgi:ElaB/YqjD/DUF883 family membrane-anchored ribosome-binding protein
MRSCGLLTLNYIKMTSIDLLKEIESWLSFNTEPSKEETAKLRKSIKEHLAEQLRIHDVVGQSEQLVCSCGSRLVKTTGGYHCGNAKCSV